MKFEAKVKFFDEIADKWDGWADLETLVPKLSQGLDDLLIQPEETIVDVGCGTGNLTRALLEKLSPDGRVVATDISSQMLKRARKKVLDTRVEWQLCDATRLPLDNESVDRIICFSVWPHVDDPNAAIEEFKRVLRPTGSLHVWHLSSRAAVNAIHAGAGDAVANDLLVPAAQTAQLFEKHGLAPYEVMDDEERYLVSARMPTRDR
jgi:demethylmenaquinone methyltransferase/2-methoxy-6-polyprenyl-1,4-benzoquinol methylase